MVLPVRRHPVLEHWKCAPALRDSSGQLDTRTILHHTPNFLRKKMTQAWEEGMGDKPKEKVLLVDDDDTLLHQMRLMLLIQL